MRIPGVALLLLASYVGALAADKEESDAIQRVKAQLVSSLDSNLPKVTLEFFLKYEGDGASAKWELKACRERNPNAGVDHEHESAMCVGAVMALKDGRTVTVLVSVGRLSKGWTNFPTLYGVSITNNNGDIHRLHRLGELPVELHRPLPKKPRDLPVPVSA